MPGSISSSNTRWVPAKWTGMSTLIGGPRAGNSVLPAKLSGGKGEFCRHQLVDLAYLQPRSEDAAAVKRRALVERFMGRHGGQLVISQVAKNMKPDRALHWYH